MPSLAIQYQTHRTIFRDPSPDTDIACLRCLVLGKVLPEAVEALKPNPWAKDLSAGLTMYKALRKAGVLVPLAGDFDAGVLVLPPWTAPYLETQTMETSA